MSDSRNSFAVVTGGSNGIGFELARQFFANGFDVLIAAQDEATCARLPTSYRLMAAP